MYITLYDFFSLTILLASCGFGVSGIVLMLKEYAADKNKKIPAIIGYLGSLISIHLVSFLTLNQQGSLPYFGDGTSLLSVLNLLSKTSMFITIPYFIHSFFPNHWSGKVQWVFNTMGILFILFKLTGIFPESPGFSIGTYVILTALGTYSIIFGTISVLKLSSSLFNKSKEFAYTFAALVVFLFSIPFLLTADFTLIPLGILDSKYYMIPYHIMGISVSFFWVTISNKWRWLQEIPDSGNLDSRENEFRRKAKALILEKELSPRELEVFTFLVKDQSYREIADKLCISPVTVKSHALNIYRKLGVKKKSHLRDFM